MIEWMVLSVNLRRKPRMGAFPTLSLVCNLQHCKSRKSSILSINAILQKKNPEWTLINANKTEGFVSVDLHSRLSLRLSCRSEMDHERIEMDERRNATKILKTIRLFREIRWPASFNLSPSGAWERGRNPSQKRFSPNAS